MVKTKKDVLEDLWNKTLAEVVDSEVKITLLKKKDPNSVMYSRKEMVMNRIVVRDYNAKMVLEEEEKSWRGKLEVLDTIRDLLKENKNIVCPRCKGERYIKRTGGEPGEDMCNVCNGEGVIK